MTVVAISSSLLAVAKLHQVAVAMQHQHVVAKLLLLAILAVNPHVAAKSRVCSRSCSTITTTVVIAVAKSSQLAVAKSLLLADVLSQAAVADSNPAR